ncbi:hypothetical protein DM860_001600 [Cuscuta australis]|uniref:F-box domain-containing protein n=1 Tax=Cuscuta australis TaxID=267555 RepID=A0A328E995_9ASTE|nr:hypothetical protein DM860_001600 [Cuscuta australis]
MEPKSPGHSPQHRKRGKRSYLETQIPDTSTQSSSTPEPDLAFPPLLPEILLEILSRLPVKSLLKFRCVSKSWRDLISSSDFVKLHLYVSSSRRDYADHRILSSLVGLQFTLKQCSLKSVMFHPVTEAFEVDYPLSSPYNSVWVVGSCNGLVCIAIEEKDLFIWNPATRKIKNLPDAGVELKAGFYFIYGFGYDELNDDYKVVGIFSIFHSSGSCETEVMSYSLRSDSWRIIGDCKGGVLLNAAGKYVNGKIHWAMCPDGVTGSLEIVSLDLSKEVFGKVGQPDYGERPSELTLGVLCGDLCVICQYEMYQMDLWVMREYGVVESWTKIVAIPPTDDPMYQSFSSPLGIGNNGEVGLVSGTDIVVYDPKTQALRYPEITNFGDILEAETYVESLVSPISDGEAGRNQQS